MNSLILNNFKWPNDRPFRRGRVVWSLRTMNLLDKTKFFNSSTRRIYNKFSLIWIYIQDWCFAKNCPYNIQEYGHKSCHIWMLVGERDDEFLVGAFIVFGSEKRGWFWGSALLWCASLGTKWTWTWIALFRGCSNRVFSFLCVIL